MKRVRLISDRGKRGTFSELTGSMSRAAGKKINRIITFSKKKPPLPGEPPSFSGQLDNPRCGESANWSQCFLFNWLTDWLIFIETAWTCRVLQECLSKNLQPSLCHKIIVHVPNHEFYSAGIFDTCNLNLHIEKNINSSLMQVCCENIINK